MGLVKSISEIFLWPDTEETPLIDLTEYKIATKTNEYTGTIIYQNDFVIKFQERNNKLVKILKSNINKMVVVSNSKDYTAPVAKQTRYI
ncbi:MAG: hypothetical protein JNM78_04970 [Cyclobacteriaceae bacterium]|nr:hypothetical protein [Cyclobacteriaceae bacterium]